MTKPILSSSEYKSSLTPLDQELQITPPPDNLQFSLLEIRDHYAALAEKYTRLAEIAKTKLAHAESLLATWQPDNSNTDDVNLDFNGVSNGNTNHNNLEDITETWTTTEVARKIDSTVEWCNNQRYQNPDRFIDEVHYLRDEKGFIHWTASGIELLSKVARTFSDIPANLTPTKAIGNHLGVSTKWIGRARIKYANWLKSGIHYYHHSRKGYLWTDKGVEILEKIHDDRAYFDAMLENNSTTEETAYKRFQPKTDVRVIPPYQGLSLANAVQKILEDNAGSILTLDYIVTMLYGKVDGEKLKVVKNRLVKTISIGKRKGKWDSVPNQPGCYTWDWQLIDKKRKQK
ncbi:MAG: hypothetical protein ACFBSE_11725 [Prochloraceae cyanobacterium]